jgi:hypothetical protein
MKVQLDMTTLTTTRRSDSANASPNVLTLRVIGETDNGNHEVEIAGPRQKVEAWLKRNGYGDGEYTIIER